MSPLCEPQNHKKSRIIHEAQEMNRELRGGREISEAKVDVTLYPIRILQTKCVV